MEKTMKEKGNMRQGQGKVDTRKGTIVAFATDMRNSRNLQIRKTWTLWRQTTRKAWEEYNGRSKQKAKTKTTGHHTEETHEK